LATLGRLLSGFKSLRTRVMMTPEFSSEFTIIGERELGKILKRQFDAFVGRLKEGICPVMEKTMPSFALDSHIQKVQA
jgi:hypothetical protein